MKSPHKKFLTTALLCLLPAVQLHAAACREADVPSVPNPDMASEYEMLEAQKAVKAYIAEQKRFLDCTSNPSRHNRAIDQMQKVAEQFNRSARRYKARLKAADMFTELVYIDLPN